MNSTSPVLPRRKLPIGIQNLREIRQGGHYYVDKTGMAADLVESGKCFFLSRPRRFGKSLLVDTFQELFEGNRALFIGLAAETRWDWSRRHPVVRISFGGGGLTSAERLEQRILEILDDNERRLGVVCRHQSVGGRLKDITIDPRWSSLCGYTDQDVDMVFSSELPGLDRDQIRCWYNGFLSGKRTQWWVVLVCLHPFTTPPATLQSGRCTGADHHLHGCRLSLHAPRHTPPSQRARATASRVASTSGRRFFHGPRAV